jgi:hypothetical protein
VIGTSPGIRRPAELHRAWTLTDKRSIGSSSAVEIKMPIHVVRLSTSARAVGTARATDLGRDGAAGCGSEALGLGPSRLAVLPEVDVKGPGRDAEEVGELPGCEAL